MSILWFKAADAISLLVHSTKPGQQARLFTFVQNQFLAPTLYIFLFILYLEKKCGLIEYVIVLSCSKPKSCFHVLESHKIRARFEFKTVQNSSKLPDRVQNSTIWVQNSSKTIRLVFQFWTVLNSKIRVSNYKWGTFRKWVQKFKNFPTSEVPPFSDVIIQRCSAVNRFGKLTFSQSWQQKSPWLIKGLSYIRKYL